MTLYGRRIQTASILLILLGTSFGIGSCSKPSSVNFSAESELRAAVEACRTGMEAPNPIDKKKELSDKGFGEASYGESPAEVQKLIDQIKQGTVSGRHVEQSNPVALVMKSSVTPNIYFAWANLDTTGGTSTKGYSRLCTIGPLAGQQTIDGLQQVEGYALANNLFKSEAEKKIFASRKAQVDDHLQLVSTRDSSNLLNSGGLSYSVVSDSKFLSFYNDAIFGSTN
jgi:hypothetical protein